MNIIILDIIRSLSTALQSQYDAAQANTIAWWLLSWITEQPQSVLLTRKAIELSESSYKALQTALHEHLTLHKPLQYCLGSVPFNEITILVEPPILIPRPETEEWSAQLIECLKKTSLKNFRVLDLCTGSGCIGLIIAYHFPQAQVVATDINPHAVALAQKNAQCNRISNISIIKSDLFESLPPQQFDLIVSNPPYIAPEEWNNLEPSVRHWEDPVALTTHDEGLSLIKTIINQAPAWLQPNSLIDQECHGQLWLEIGYNQGPVVQDYMYEHSFKKVTILKDLARHNRVVIGSLL